MEAGPPDEKSEELVEALKEYERHMNEDYASGGVDVVTPDAADLDDDQGE